MYVRVANWRAARHHHTHFRLVQRKFYCINYYVIKIEFIFINRRHRHRRCQVWRAVAVHKAEVGILWNSLNDWTMSCAFGTWSHSVCVIHCCRQTLARSDTCNPFSSTNRHIHTEFSINAKWIIAANNWLGKLNNHLSFYIKSSESATCFHRVCIISSSFSLDFILGKESTIAQLSVRGDLNCLMDLNSSEYHFIIKLKTPQISRGIVNWSRSIVTLRAQSYHV